MSPRARTGQERLEAAEARRARRAAVTEPNVVMEAAAAFLAVRPRSVEETRRRLNHLGYPAALCDEVVERLVELRYLDDADFAQAWVESRDRAKPRGEMALRRELQLKGIAADIVTQVLQARTGQAPDPDASGSEAGADADRRAAQRLLDRRAPSLAREPDLRRRCQRAYALLARNGFAPDICNEVASSVRVPEADEAD